MTATKNITSLKLKIRIGSKQIVANPVTKKYELSQGNVLGNESCCSISMSICNKSEMVKSHNLVIPSSDTLKVQISSMCSNKRSSSVVGDGEKAKRRKMDRNVTQQCSFILKQLMNHPAGWVFKQPVDPVKLKIPDYHDIISHPMDLGTVKNKLNKNEYSSVDEFAAHVRLTFSNAMTYNPPGNDVHMMAKELNALFDSDWSALEAKWSGDRKNVPQKQNISRLVKSIDIQSNGTKKTPRNLISALEKQKLREKLLEIVKGKVPSHLQGFLRKIGLDLQRVERIEEIFDALGDEDLWELQKITSSSWVVQTPKNSPAKEQEHVSQQSRVKITPKGTDNGIGNAPGSAVVIPPPKSVTSKCGVCLSMRCECNKQKDNAHAGSDILVEKSRDHLDVSMRASGTELRSDIQLRKSEPESTGFESAFNEDRISSCLPVSIPDTTTRTSEECAPNVDFPLSPQKALRAALLKSRFADTIFKAKQKALLDQGDKADPVKLQQEKERLEREQQEERAKIEAQIKASEEAARIKAEAERKLQLEREREDARLALQQMVKTVDIDNDHKILIDLELLSGCSLSDQLSCGSCETSPKALEQLGLFMKNDYMEEEDDDTVLISGGGDDGEEGEIIS